MIIRISPDISGQTQVVRQNWRSSNGKRFLHPSAQEITDHLSEQLILERVQALRDVTQNFTFAVLIFDKDWTKKQAFRGINDRAFVSEIPQHDIVIIPSTSHNIPF